MTFCAAGDTIEMENGRGTKGDAVVRRGRTETRPAACATRLEAEALAVEIGIYAEMSKQCRELPESDPLCTAYQDARDAATLAHTAIQKLGDMLRKIAKITRPSLWEELVVAKGGTCEPTPDGWNLASACVELVRRRAQVDCDPDGRTGAAPQPPGMG